MYMLQLPIRRWKDNDQSSLDLLGRFDGNRVFPELTEYWINSLESSINFFTNFGSRQDDLAGDEDQKDNLGIDHAINQTRKQFRFILSMSVQYSMRRRRRSYRREHAMTVCQPFKTNGEFDVATSHDILNLEIHEFRIEAEFLDDSSILS